MDSNFTVFGDFAERIEQCDEIDDVWRVTEHFGRSQGLPRVACAYAGVQRVGSLETPEVRTNCSGNLADQWTTEKLYTRDPMVRRAVSSKTSFCWGVDYVGQHTVDPKVRLFYRDLSGSVRSMFVVPLPRVERGAFGIGILGNEMPNQQFESFIAERRSVLMLAMIYADRRMIEMHGAKVRSTVGLLPREAECLEWIASGVDVDGIAEKMGITVATAHAYLSAAKRKLGAETMEHAIAIALKHRLMRP